jgi:signal transduction histidine kinase
VEKIPDICHRVNISRISGYSTIKDSTIIGHVIEGTMPPRILIVDDEAIFMRALCDTLRDRGYDAIGFSSADDALMSMRTATFDILLVDLMMPGIDGIGLVQEARSIDPDLACIIMTGEGSIASAVQAMKIGALDYVIKPFKISAIIPILARALETRELRMKNAKLEHQLREHVAELYAVNKSLDLAKKDAEHANREKSVFLSNMSHELRTPLNAILGFSRILSDETMVLEPAQEKDFANDILQAGEHLLTLINEILDLAKVESGAMTLSMEGVAVAELFVECKTMIEPLAKKREIRVQFPEKTNILVRSDRTRLKQVLINLLSNAIKYNREHGNVIVDCVALDSGRVRISVQDTGAGLDSSQLEGIFQPFNRLGREILDEEGTGIGLVLTKRILEAMQGEITVTSVVGVGSTFHIVLDACNSVLPRIESLAGSIVRDPQSWHFPSMHRNFLYVEDNPANLKLVQELVRMRFGIELLCARDGRSGFEMACTHQPQVILMDINLPGMDGFETRQLLQEDPRTAHIPVIAVTASAMSEEVKKVRNSGFFRCITKPIDVVAFVDAIESALQYSTEYNDLQEKSV